MHKNGLLMIALVLIAVGVAGVFSTTWFQGPSSFSGTISSMMMGGGMRMDRNQSLSEKWAKWPILPEI